jgi:hypothetical protein
MADRMLFERSTEGRRTVRGAVVKALQKQLTDRGFDTLGLDGVYGRVTENAVKALQQHLNRTAHGAVTLFEWKALFPGMVCPIEDRCLQLTADFEGHGFGKAAGDFDNMGLTWGIIGFTLGNGELQVLLGEVNESHSPLIDAAFGPLALALREMLASSLAEQLVWARSISLGTERYKIKAEWAVAFEMLGDFPEVQALQMARVKKYWTIARHDFKQFDLKTERGLALCFDVAVQNGGVDASEREDIAWALQNKPGLAERDRLVVIGNVVADHSSAKWREAVYRRKNTIAMGLGTVNGSVYELRSWGLDDVAL